MDPSRIRAAAERDYITLGSALGGVVAWSGAVLPAALSHERSMVPGVWWPLAVLQLLAFLLVAADWTSSVSVKRAAVVAMVLGGTLATALWGADQVSPVLMVLTAGAAGFVVSTALAFGIALLQSVALVVILVSQDASVVWSLIYSALMFFATLMVHIVVRERAARRQAAFVATELEHTNGELERANTELARTNARLRQANTDLSDAQQALAEASRAEERMRISRDLHDGMGQQLTALNLHLNLISRHVDPEGEEHVAQARVLVAGVIRDVRGVVTQLRNGHTSARDEIARLARSLPRPHTFLDLDPAVDEAPQSVAVTLVRVVQEGLTNVAKHSQAENAWVTIARDGDAVTFEIRDDGPGLADFTPGNGLSGMGERVGLLGGEVDWSTAPGHGFTLRGRLPDNKPA